MKSPAAKFYTSHKWRTVAAAYRESRAFLCEKCLAEGRHTIGTDVHHIVKLTPENIDDPEISIGWDNLMLLCDKCHEDMHPEHRAAKRYSVGEDGRVTVTEGRR